MLATCSVDRSAREASSSQERIVMGDKGSKDKGKKEQQKKARLTPKEKRKAKLNKKASGGDS